MPVASSVTSIALGVPVRTSYSSDAAVKQHPAMIEGSSQPQQAVFELSWECRHKPNSRLRFTVRHHTALELAGLESLLLLSQVGTERASANLPHRVKSPTNQPDVDLSKAASILPCPALHRTPSAVARNIAEELANTPELLAAFVDRRGTVMSQKMRKARQRARRSSTSCGTQRVD